MRLLVSSFKLFLQSLIRNRRLMENSCTASSWSINGTRLKMQLIYTFVKTEKKTIGFLENCLKFQIKNCYSEPSVEHICSIWIAVFWQNRSCFVLLFANEKRTTKRNVCLHTYTHMLYSSYFFWKHHPVDTAINGQQIIFFFFCVRDK